MCGAITTVCSIPNCDNYVRYVAICDCCQANIDYPTGV